VLAVACSEGALALIAGARGMRQWGRRRWSRRSGVAVCADPSDLQPGLVAAAAATGLAALTFVGHPSGSAQQAAVGEADQLGLPVVMLVETREAQHGRQ
jgi:hypothetical protein